jgi:putative ubiquitin-RnfH superfamily antitoxin RatB of RatAB toxin-antitoxin module
MRVTIACAPPGREAIVELEVAEGTTVAEAVTRSALVPGLGLEPAALGFALHGQQARPDTPLREGDRVEILLPLRVDPKTARRQRARRPARGPAAERRTGPGKGG